MLNYTPNGRTRLGRPLKRLLDEAETGLSRPNSGWICYYYYYYYGVDIVVSCHRPFLPGTSLEPTVIPTVSLQVSHCSTFRITQYV